MLRLPHYCPVAAYQDWGLDGLVEMIWQYLRLLRIYTKPKVPTHAPPACASLGHMRWVLVRQPPGCTL